MFHWRRWRNNITWIQFCKLHFIAIQSVLIMTTGNQNMTFNIMKFLFQRQVSSFNDKVCILGQSSITHTQFLHINALYKMLQTFLLHTIYINVPDKQRVNTRGVETIFILGRALFLHGASTNSFQYFCWVTFYELDRGDKVLLWVIAA